MSICKDCFHSYVCEQFNEHRECDNKKCHFANDHFIPADLINRLQAETKRLKTVKGHIDTLIHRDCEYPTEEAYNEAFQKVLEHLYDNANVKAEAYKEFAERLKEKMVKHNFKYADTLFSANVATAPMVNNLLKEMEGGASEVED